MDPRQKPRRGRGGGGRDGRREEESKRARTRAHVRTSRRWRKNTPPEVHPRQKQSAYPPPRMSRTSPRPPPPHSPTIPHESRTEYRDTISRGLRFRRLVPPVPHSAPHPPSGDGWQGAGREDKIRCRVSLPLRLCVCVSVCVCVCVCVRVCVCVCANKRESERERERV